MIICGPTNPGSRYNPVTDTWRTMSTVDAPNARNNHTVVWTGTEAIVWGANVPTVSGGRYCAQARRQVQLQRLRRHRPARLLQHRRRQLHLPLLQPHALLPPRGVLRYLRTRPTPHPRPSAMEGLHAEFQ